MENLVIGILVLLVIVLACYHDYYNTRSVSDAIEDDDQTPLMW